MNYEPIIGLEIHVQLNTKSKLFCACSAEHFGKEPNSQVCPVCLGLPGAIPSPPNIEAVKKAVLIAKALGCALADNCYFERKCYFYPDLPKGFQISQHHTAIGERGEFEGVRVRRVHLEEDAAKLVHEEKCTLIDFNRAGVSLVEIVTEPVLKSSSRAKYFLKELQKLFRHLGVSDADMEKGSLRLEANISLKRAGAKKLPGYRVELKNLNSFNFLAKALDVEIARQEKILQSGRCVVQETRGYNGKTGKTYSQRRKEAASDYRYFPEPDLPPLTVKSLLCEERIVRPEELRQRLEKEYGLSRRYARALVANPKLLALSERVMKEAGGMVGAEYAVNAIINHRFGDPAKLGARGLVKAMATEKAKKEALLSGKEIGPLVDEAVSANPQAVSDYRAGKRAALQFLLGQLMRETGGRINPKDVQKMLEKKLGGKK